MKRRIVRPNRRSYTGRHVGSPGGHIVRFESGLERDFLTLTRFRLDVVEIVEQPFTVTFVDSAGRSRSYTPDFKVTYQSKTVIYEIKYKTDLRKHWVRYREPYTYMRQWAREQGMYFRIMTEGAIRSIRFHNANMLLPYLREVPDPAMAARIRTGLATGTLTILQLLKGVCQSDAERPAFFAALWPMLAQRVLTVDFNRPLGMDLEVSLPS